MRRFMIVTAALAMVALVGSPTMQANADVVRGMPAVKSATQNFTPI